MKASIAYIVLAALVLVGAGPDAAPEDIQSHPECPVCGMNRQQYAHSRMLIDYQEGPVGTCSIYCTGADIAVNRHKTVRGVYAADYSGRQLIPAAAAFWVIGGDRSGVMTQRAKWAFEKMADAQAFLREHGGTLGNYEDVMKATFEDMYADIKMVRERAHRKRPEAKQSPVGSTIDDRKQHRECKYCGMDRDKFGYSRMLVRYDDGTAVPTCSIHCTAIDLALNPHKRLSATLAGDYASRKLLEAERAVWVLGGDKMGVMSIRGKWAFGDRRDAEQFIRKQGGAIASYDEVMKAVFEDMYEILRPFCADCRPRPRS